MRRLGPGRGRRQRRGYGEAPPVTDPKITWLFPGVGTVSAGIGDTGTVEMSLKDLDELFLRLGGRRIEVAGLAVPEPEEAQQ